MDTDGCVKFFDDLVKAAKEINGVPVEYEIDYVDYSVKLRFGRAGRRAGYQYVLARFMDAMRKSSSWEEYKLVEIPSTDPVFDEIVEHARKFDIDVEYELSHHHRVVTYYVDGKSASLVQYLKGRFRGIFQFDKNWVNYIPDEV